MRQTLADWSAEALLCLRPALAYWLCGVVAIADGLPQWMLARGRQRRRSTRSR